MSTNADPILQKKLDIRLIEAVLECDTPSLVATLRDGASPNACYNTGISVLVIAATAGMLENVNLLVEAGANVNRRVIVTGSDIRTALHCAIYVGHHEIIGYLLDKGADPRLTNHDSENAALALISSGMLDTTVDEEERHAALALLRRMLSASEIVGKTEHEGYNLLTLALYRDTGRDVIDLLFASGANPYERTHFGGSATHQNWDADSLWKLHALAAHGVDLNARDWEGANAFAYAQDAPAVSALLDFGADLHHLDDMGRNSLAVILDRQKNQEWPIEAMTMLVEAGIDTEHVDLTGASVESRLVEYDTPEARQMLAVIGAHKARNAITRVVKAAAPRPA